MCDIILNNNGEAVGMLARYLRRRGLYRIRGTSTFMVHRIDIGGIYIWADSDYRIRIKDLNIDRIFHRFRELREFLDHLFNSLDASSAIGTLSPASGGRDRGISFAPVNPDPLEVSEWE